jgi:hypothetical protein
VLTKAEEIERVQALRALHVLDTESEERFDRVVRVAQRVFEVPMVAVNLVDENRLFVKASVGMTGRYRPREGALCALAVQGTEPLIIRDGPCDPTFQDHPMIAGGPRLKFYAGQPLTAPGGHTVGTLCLYDTEPHDIGPKEIDLLRDLAGWVERELAAADELDRAAEVQRALLPRAAPVVEGYGVAGLCIPAQQVGGDFYDWFLVEGALQITIADVMGKGIPAALIAAGVRSIMRGASRYNNLEEAVRRVAAAVEPDLAETSTFVTLFAARLDAATHRLEYVDAGHGLAGIFDSRGYGRRLESDALPIGVLPGQSWPLRHDTFAAGDTFVSSSDGLLDCFESVGRGLAAMRDLVVATHSATDMTRQIEKVSRDRSPTDDVTAVVIRRMAGE